MKKRSESISRIISRSKEVEKVARPKKRVEKAEKKPLTKEELWNYVKRYWQLYLLLLLPMIYFLVFKYSPMYYILIAFKKYSIVQKVSEMPWAKNHGFEYFLKAFKNKDFINALRNTVFLNLFDIIVGFPVPIIFALLLNELRFKFFKKTVQTVAYMPHFLSWVIIYGLAMQLFSPTNGFVNMVITKLGGQAVHFLDDPNHWVRTYIGLGVWQSFGWNSIIYLAAISGISPELYEAASVDGANRFQKMWHITLPGIRPTIVVLLILALGNVLGSGFDRPYVLQNNLVMKNAEVIATFVYKYGIKGLQFSLTTAVGLFQSIANVIFLLLANWFSRKMGERGIM
ncbi:MAG: sugar ABC transporter permease [Lachnospiraceae bacterium]|nr:sugar ABC transporter permease [Lachnospiraceae bacterium]MBO6298074.1 sugar ABC transporter permease [Lachnospiraceae bacterium]